MTEKISDERLAAAIHRLIGLGNALVGFIDTPQAIQAGAADAYNGWKSEVEASMALALSTLGNSGEMTGTWSDGGKSWEPDVTARTEPVEILARALCQIDGQAPDADAPRMTVCGPYGEVLPSWEAYREKAEGILAGVEIVPAEAIERLARFIAEEVFGYAWDGLGPSGRVTDQGFKPFHYSMHGGTRIQGTQNDLIDVARNGLTAALSTKKDA